ncbi:MAG: Na+/H+ antiporter subunit E [Betaproteobacteria bacterium]
MTRWLPAPVVSAALLVVWLLLNGTLAAGHVLLGAFLAWLLPLVTTPFANTHPRIRRPLAIVRLGFVVLYDIVVSNVEVARRVLGPERAITPGFVRVPLAVTDPYAIAALANIITMTPGTLTADIGPDNRYLLVHAFHLDDPEALVAGIKVRYEAPLMEIFE